MEDNSIGGKSLKEEFNAPFKRLGELNAIMQKALWNGLENRYRNREHIALLSATNNTFNYSTEAVSTTSEHGLYQTLSSHCSILTHKGTQLCVLFIYAILKYDRSGVSGGR